MTGHAGDGPGREVRRSSGRHYEDWQLGDHYTTVGRTVTEADVTNFSGVSGDFNELHTNEEMMQGSQFGARIAHGALVLAMVTGLRQQTGLFEGTIIAFAEIRSWRFKLPVLIGDTIHVEAEVVELRETSKPDRGIMVQRVAAVNQKGETVQEGEMVTLIKRRPSD